MKPLEGITVVTLEHAIAAPFCTRQLADLGARVIKVGAGPGTGDFARAYDERVKGLLGHRQHGHSLGTRWAQTAKRPLGVGVCCHGRSSYSVVAGAGFEPTTFGL